MAFASEKLIQVLNKIKPPYNISGLTQDTVLDALKQKEKVGAFVQQILEERSNLRTALEKRPYVLKVHPSDANFLLVEVQDASTVYAALIQEKVIVRNRSSVLHCAGCLRITVGTNAENTTLLAALDRVCQP
jgi:histidinol-phosphate aminotransferase